MYLIGFMSFMATRKPLCLSMDFASVSNIFVRSKDYKILNYLNDTVISMKKYTNLIENFQGCKFVFYHHLYLNAIFDLSPVVL
mmetsp:Transcript_10190/g.22602  ORF Transcript_10190/g.22602 Transcript_10190/m.22602 type:complete len:83 (+) Transcript_10190:902-1150(+)